MANKELKPNFPYGLSTQGANVFEQGFVNDGLIEHGEKSVLTVPTGSQEEYLETAIRYNHVKQEFEGAYKDGWRTLGGGGGINWVLAPVGLVVEDTNKDFGYLVDTRTTQTKFVLPKNPVVGTSVSVCDLFGSFSKMPLTVSPDGNTLYGKLDDMIMSTDHVAATFTYSGKEQGWVVTAGVGLGQGRVYNRTVKHTILNKLTTTVQLDINPAMVDIYVNGSRLADKYYSLEGYNVLFNPALPSGVELQVIEFTPVQLTYSSYDKEMKLLSKKVDSLTDKTNNQISGFTFKTGALLKSQNDFIYDETTQQFYYWGGEFPKLVPKESSKSDDGSWLEIGIIGLSNKIGSKTGASVIGTETGRTVQDEINNSNEKIDLVKTPAQKVDFLFKTERKFNNNLFVELQEYQQGTYHYAPTSVVLPSGRILSAYTVKAGNNIDPGQDSTRMYLQISISDDDGETFTVKDLVNKGAGFATSESVLVHNHIDGNLYCFYTSMKGVTGWGHSEKGIDENNTSQIEYVISRDSGETWSTPINITAEVKPSDAYFCSIAPTQCAYDKGKLVIPFYFLKTKTSWINEAYITLDKDGVFEFGEIVRDEYQDDTVGRSGGEIGFGNFSDGTLFAIERAFDDTSKSFRIAQQKLLLKDVKTKKWYVKGQFATSDCQASFLRVGLEHGFNKEYLFVVAPIGDNGVLNGRKNMRIFDCSDDFSNPKNLALIAIQENIATEYSTTQLLPTGAFISMWHGRQWLIHSTVYTVNRKTSSKYINQPPHSGYKVLDISTGNYSNDLFNGEIVKSKGSGEFYTYNSGSFSNINTAKTKSIDSVTDILNANEASIFYLNAGSNGSQIGEISGGYTGMTVKILVTTSSSVVDLVRAKSGVGSRNRIMYSDSVDGNKYRMTGGTGTGSALVTLTKTDSGWYLDKEANTL